MKYHELPSFKMLSTYKKGYLSAQDRNWVARTLQQNAVVQAVAESVNGIDGRAVKAISQRTDKAITAQYMKVGFWSKFGIWIGLSSIILLFGLFLIFHNNTPTEYAKTDFTLGISEVSSSETSSPNQAPKSSEIVTPLLTKNTVYKNQGKETQKENLQVDTGKSNPAIPAKEKLQNTLDKKAKEIHPTPPSKVKEATTKSSKNESFSSTENNTNIPQKSSKIILAIKRVQVLSKQFANEKHESHTRKGNDPLRTSQQQKGSRSAKAFADLPKYPGGDEALTLYFVGKLHPLQIPRDESKKYDRAVRLDLTIKANGKLDTYKVFGHLNPIHQKELEKAIKQLPRFSKGSGSTIYSLGISF